MKAFARHITDSDGNQFRLNTVLQFGDSWDIIGSAILINPGSSKPCGDVTDDEAQHLSSIIGYGDCWKRFSIDSTMAQTEKIFNGWYLGRPLELKGVLLLFNLFNLINQNLHDALARMRALSSPYLQINQDDINQLAGCKPTYLGWGNTGKHHLRSIAEPIFNHVIKYSEYLNRDFDANTFYHPGYVNRSYKRNARTIAMLKQFEESFQQ